MRELNSAIHLHTAAINNNTVLVFHSGELIGSGKIEEMSGHSITIKGEKFMIDTCSFYAAKR